MENFQPTPQEGPFIRKVPPLPEMPGMPRRRPDTIPGEHRPEVEDDGDDTTRIGPNMPGREIDGGFEPDLDHPDERDIKKIIDEIRKGPGKPTIPEKKDDKKDKGPTIH